MAILLPMRSLRAKTSEQAFPPERTDTPGLQCEMQLVGENGAASTVAKIAISEIEEETDGNEYAPKWGQERPPCARY